MLMPIGAAYVCNRLLYMCYKCICIIASLAYTNICCETAHLGEEQHGRDNNKTMAQ